MVPATATSNSQKTTRAPSTSESKEAGGEEEDRLNSNPIQVSLATGNFAGRLRHFLPAWSSITTDQNILEIVQHSGVS